MKIIVNAANDQVLGASILASEGGELVPCSTPSC